MAQLCRDIFDFLEETCFACKLILKATRAYLPNGPLMKEGSRRLRTFLACMHFLLLPPTSCRPLPSLNLSCLSKSGRLWAAARSSMSSRRDARWQGKGSRQTYSQQSLGVLYYRPVEFWGRSPTHSHMMLLYFPSAFNTEVFKLLPGSSVTSTLKLVSL